VVRGLKGAKVGTMIVVKYKLLEALGDFKDKIVYS
jgi:hypothetical protein